MVVPKQQVVQKALDDYIEAQERGLEVVQKALAMHQKMHRAELKEAESLGVPVSDVEHIDEDQRTLRDELLDGQREIEATRQRIEEARTARLNGPRASEEFLNDHQTDTWADQTALDAFGKTPPVNSGVGPIEDYEPGHPAGDDVPELPPTEPATPPPVDASGEPPTADGATDKMTTWRTGQKKPDWTLKPGEAQPTPGPSAPVEPDDRLPSAETGAAPPTAGPGGAEPPEDRGLVSQIAKWLAGTALFESARVGAEVAKNRFKKIGAVVVGAAAAAGLIYTFGPSGDTPEPQPPESPVVEQAPVEPEPPPPNPFEPTPVPEPAPPNPFGGPESPPPNPFGGPEAPPPNPFEPPHVPEPAPPNPFEPGGGTGGDEEPAVPAPANPFDPGQHGSNPGGGTDSGGDHGGGTDSGGDHGGGTDSGGGTGG
ncbi:hypothetical protein EIL87_05660 [Saccharopolyspora rhizosphaerae]|uniref:Uncharacterized protein n=1 Tax=Saccharopolyspora rhizosphaerae TaxID=2492662 RepID=A0A426JZI6_9PSEU|nr:hypothetical protein [Saccharopolyspora rhizosphaerae]RRO18609.1 hypothetical protein EIL87_05660 [Saccharopolyspora rhizosphaerae]